MIQIYHFRMIRIKKKEYYKLYDRFVKADNWFKTQDNDYFER